MYLREAEHQATGEGGWSGFGAAKRLIFGATAPVIAEQSASVGARHLKRARTDGAGSEAFLYYSYVIRSICSGAFFTGLRCRFRRVTGIAVRIPNCISQ